MRNHTPGSTVAQHVLWHRVEVHLQSAFGAIIILTQLRKVIGM